MIKLNTISLSIKLSAASQRLAMIAGASLIMSVVVIFSLWLGVVNPDNSARYQQQVQAQTEQYQQHIFSYLHNVEQQLLQFAQEATLASFSSSPLPNASLENSPSHSNPDIKRAMAALAAQHKLWLSQSGELLEASIYELSPKTRSFVAEERGSRSPSVDASLPNNEQVIDSPLSRFVLLNMLNRLQVGKARYIEVAKSVDKTQWQLHKMLLLPLSDQSVAKQSNNAPKNVAGAIHFTLSLDGLRQSFSAFNPLFGQVTIRQFIEKEAPLMFFSYGAVDTSLSSSSPKFSQVILDVPNSYWVVNYQPSVLFYQKSQQTPAWLWACGLATFLFCVLIGARLLRPVRLTVPSSRDEKRASADSIDEILVDEPVIVKGRPDDSDPLPITSNSQAALKANTDLILKNKGANNPSVSDSSLRAKEAMTDSAFPHSIFRAYDIRGLAYEQLDNELMYRIGQTVASQVLAAGDHTMVVGYDARIHSPEFFRHLTEGIISTGCHVVDIGLVPTPLMNFTAVHHPRTSSGVIITASHNPAEYNGCKIVIKGSTLVDDEIQSLKNQLIKGDVITNSTKGRVVADNFSQKYIDYISGDVALVDGWKVVIDAGNGAASELAPRLFNQLQCEVTPLYCQFDGRFPNHPPDPSLPENLKDLITEVKSTGSDIGFAFDGDADRLMVVTPKGRIVWPDQLMMLFARDVLSREKNGVVVFDVKSSHLLGQTILQAGGQPVMWKTGHSHIKSKMKETDAVLGGEFSGHIFFKERWFGFDDGLYAAARLLEVLTATGKTIDELIDKLPSLISTPEIKIPVDENQKFALIDLLHKNAHFNEATVVDIDGLRVDFSHGWGLIRASNTSAALTLRFEAESDMALTHIMDTFREALDSVGLKLPSL